jgi:tetratricopeptide (TPR) repeat protein
MEKNMSAVFWAATIVMTLLAFTFVTMPLIENNRRFPLVGIAAALPIFAASLYWFVGSPQAAGVDIQEHSSKPAVAAQQKKSVGSVASMIGGLAARLKDNPDDGKSWLLLARSYKHLNRLPEALDAYQHAVALGEYDGDLAALSGSPSSGDLAIAQVFGNVRLSERSKKIVLPTDTVFIFARAVGGPPMPVAVLQRPVSDLPLDFLLNDSQAMSADMKLSSYEQVIVTARISRSGVASDALQGLEAISGVIVVAENRHLKLTIE